MSKRSLTKLDATQQEALPPGALASASFTGAARDRATSPRMGDGVMRGKKRAKGRGGREKRVPPQGAVVRSSGDEHMPGEYIPASTDTLPSTHIPSSPENIPLTHYKGTSLKNIGRDKDGKVIPHRRSEITARKVAAWAVGGYTKEDIAIILNIRPGLVEECYGRELRHGKDLVGMDMTAHVIKRAKENDNMARFVLKSQYGWRDGDNKPLDTGLLNIHIHT